MKPDLSERFMECDSVKVIWEGVNHLYTKVEDDSGMADLMTKAMEMCKITELCQSNLLAEQFME